MHHEKWNLFHRRYLPRSAATYTSSHMNLTCSESTLRHAIMLSSYIRFIPSQVAWLRWMITSSAAFTSAGPCATSMSLANAQCSVTSTIRRSFDVVSKSDRSYKQRISIRATSPPPSTHVDRLLSLLSTSASSAPCIISVLCGILHLLTLMQYMCTCSRHSQAQVYILLPFLNYFLSASNFAVVAQRMKFCQVMPM